ncbi:unnamed protein product [Leptosia nina]|uniref:Uncharacterized protein n=1 Tax=Leptosia nina TaxID=320188 RepID=A0AAV1IWM0_9NEOP
MLKRASVDAGGVKDEHVDFSKFFLIFQRGNFRKNFASVNTGRIQNEHFANCLRTERNKSQSFFFSRFRWGPKPWCS